MATFALNTDVAADQAAARDNSSLLIKDGTKLTGNVQTLSARITTTQAYTNGDVLNISIGALPKGVRVLPSLCSLFTNATSAFTGEIKLAGGGDAILNTTQAKTQTPAVIVGDSKLIVESSADFIAKITLGADLADASTFIVTLAYAAAA